MLAIPMPPDFPSSDFDALQATTSAREERDRLGNNDTPNPDWKGLASALNGVTYRFRAMAEAQDAFQAIINSKSSKTMEDRYLEETALFSFFTNGLSALELTYFAVYGVAAQAQPIDFPLIQRKPRDIKPKLVTEKFEARWPTEPLTVELRATLDSQSYKDLADVRNILSHQAAPPRAVAIRLTDTLGGPSVPDPPPTTTWIGRPLDHNLLPLFRSYVADRLTAMIAAASTFSASKLNPAL